MSASSHRSLLCSPRASLLWFGLLCLQACAFEYGSLDDLTCDEEGKRDAQRVCTDGVWVLDEGAPVDMMRGVDAASQDMDLPDEGSSPADMRADMAPVPDMMRDMDLPDDLDQPVDMTDLPDMAPVPDMMTPNCPTTDEGFCDLLFQEVPDEAVCFSLVAPVTTASGCVIPSGTRCDCKDASIQCIVSPNSNRGVCEAPCEPESEDAYCTRVQRVNPGVDICGTRFQVLDNCGQARTSVSCTFCAVNEVCEDLTAPSQCVCNPLDPVADRAVLCQAANQSCGAVQINDGCGGRVTVNDCATCGADETCEPNPTSPAAGQPENVCVAPNPLSQLPQPAGLSSGAQFGSSMATDGEWLAIGAPNDLVTNTAGVGVRCGAVYLYALQNGSWTFSSRIVVNDSAICNNGDEEFGFAVDIEDGVLVIGAPGDGSGGRLHIYELLMSGWSRVLSPELSGSTGARFGHSVAVKPLSDGSNDYRVAVGVPEFDSVQGATTIQNTGAAYNLRRFVRNNAREFTLSQMPLPSLVSGARVGTSVDFFMPELFGAGAPGYNNQSITGARGGALFAWGLIPGGDWASIQGSPFGSTFFGVSTVQVNDAFGTSQAYGGSWSITGSPGRTVSTGSVFIAELAGSPSFVGEVRPTGAAPGDLFGAALAAHANAFIAGAPGDDGAMNAHADTGAVYLYTWTGNAWSELYTTRNLAQTSNARSGSSVALSQDWAFFGSPGEANGQVYLIDRALIP